MSQENKIYFTEVESIDTSHQFTALNKNELKFLSESLDDLNLMFERASMNSTKDNYSISDLDHILQLWNKRDKTLKKFEEEEIVSILGAAFGELVNNIYQTTWSMTKDDFGSDYCCYRKNDNSSDKSFIIFPFSSVFRIIDLDKESSLEAVMLFIQEQYNN